MACTALFLCIFYLSHLSAFLSWFLCSSCWWSVRSALSFKYIPACVCASLCLCVCICFGLVRASLAEIAILFLGPCGHLIAFVLSTFPALRHWCHRIMGLSPTVDSLMDTTYRFQASHPPLSGPHYLHNHYKGPFFTQATDQVCHYQLSGSHFPSVMSMESAGQIRYSELQQSMG